MNTRIKINSAFFLSLVFLFNACSKPPEAEETTKEESSANTSRKLISHKNVGPEDAKKLIDSDDPSGNSSQGRHSKSNQAASTERPILITMVIVSKRRLVKWIETNL